MKTHRISLSGPASKGARISAATLADLLDVFVKGARASIRLRVSGRSTATGSDPAWLVQASEFEVTGLQEGSTVIELESPTLDSSFHVEHFNQFENATTALDAFEESYHLAEQAEDSDLYDEGFLAICLRLNRVFTYGYDNVMLSSASAPHVTTFTPEKIESISQLKRRLPRPMRANIAGKVEYVKHSDKQFVIELSDGTKVKGIATDQIAEQLNDAWGMHVLVQGQISFQASGKVSHIDAEAVTKTTSDKTAMWSRAPRPLGVSQQLLLPVSQSPRSGIAQLIGRWPGDESDDEVEEALKAFS